MVLSRGEESGYLNEHGNPLQEDKVKHWWHPPFYQGLIAVLDPTEEALDFQDEHRLSKESLRIDVVVTQKNGTIPANHDIVKEFKKYNLFEYKAHNDSLTVEDYIACVGKGHLYAAFNNVSLNDITIIFVSNKHPRTVIQYLKEVRKFTVKDKENGLFHVQGDVFPVQILVSKKDDNIVLRNLHDNLTPAEVFETINAFEKLRQGEKNVYVERIILANWNAYKEASKMYPTLKERFLEIEQEGWFDELKQKEVNQERLEIAKGLKLKNVPLSIIVDTTKIPLQEVEAL